MRITVAAASRRGARHSGGGRPARGRAGDERVRELVHGACRGRLRLRPRAGRGGPRLVDEQRGRRREHSWAFRAAGLGMPGRCSRRMRWTSSPCADAGQPNAARLRELGRTCQQRAARRVDLPRRDARGRLQPPRQRCGDVLPTARARWASAAGSRPARANSATCSARSASTTKPRRGPEERGARPAATTSSRRCYWRQVAGEGARPPRRARPRPSGSRARRCEYGDQTDMLVDRGTAHLDLAEVLELAGRNAESAPGGPRRRSRCSSGRVTCRWPTRRGRASSAFSRLSTDDACSSPAGPGSSAPTSRSGSPRSGDEVVVLDKLTYSGNPANLEGAGVELVVGDICDADAVAEAAAGLRGDRQLRRRDARRPLDPRRRRVHRDRRARHLRAALDTRATPGIRLVQVSTDEVYGDVPEGESSREGDPLRPSSPYSASKAGGDLQVLAAVRTFGVDACITRGANTYGPNQYPEKLIPLFVTNALDGEPLPVYGDGRQRREWLHADDHCAAVERVLRDGKAGEVYNVGGEEHENIEITRRILELTGGERGADPPRRGPARPRPPLLPRRLEAARPRLGPGALDRRGGPDRDGGLVPRAPLLVGADQDRRVPRVLRAAVRRAPALAVLQGSRRRPGKFTTVGYPEPPAARHAQSPPLPPARSRGRIAPPGRSQPADPAGGDRHHLRDQRPRLGPRRRDEPVGRVRLREARRHLRQDPGPLLPRHDARPLAAREDQRAARRGRGQGGRLLARSIHGQERRRRHPPARGRQLRARLEALDPVRPCPAGRAARGPARLLAGQEPALAEEPLPRLVRCSIGWQEALGDQLGVGGVVRPRRRLQRDAARLAARGGQGPGGRGALVRACASAGRRVRRLQRHARPGVRRDRRRDADRRPGRARDEAPGAPLRRQGRADVLLLELRRPHRGGHGRLRVARSRSRTSSRSATRTTRSRRTTRGAPSRCRRQRRASCSRSRRSPA